MRLEVRFAVRSALIALGIISLGEITLPQAQALTLGSGLPLSFVAAKNPILTLGSDVSQIFKTNYTLPSLPSAISRPQTELRTWIPNLSMISSYSSVPAMPELTPVFDPSTWPELAQPKSSEIL